MYGKFLVYCFREMVLSLLFLFSFISVCVLQCVRWGFFFRLRYFSSQKYIDKLCGKRIFVSEMPNMFRLMKIAFGWLRRVREVRNSVAVR